MASNTNCFLIYHLDQDGALVKKYDHTDGMATCVIDSINIVQAMLKTDTVKDALRQIAVEYCEYRKQFRGTPWFLQDGEGTREERIGNFVARFLKLFLIPAFPTIFIGDNLEKDYRGTCHRPVWEDRFLLFHQKMQLNGARLKLMLDLKMRSNSAEDKEGHILNAYRISQFQLVDTILHELGHVYTTYLGKGVCDSPRTPADKRGESGHRLTQLVWGGRMHHLRDTRVGDSDYGAGAVFMRKQDGEEENQWFSVTKEAIDSTLDLKFQFPLENGCITKLEPGTFRHLRNWGDGEEVYGKPGHSDMDPDWTNPGLHDEWPERRDRIDPEWKKRFDEQERMIEEAW